MYIAELSPALFNNNKFLPLRLQCSLVKHSCRYVPATTAEPFLKVGTEVPTCGKNGRRNGKQCTTIIIRTGASNRVCVRTHAYSPTFIPGRHQSIPLSPLASAAGTRPGARHVRKGCAAAVQAGPDRPGTARHSRGRPRRKDELLLFLLRLRRRRRSSSCCVRPASQTSVDSETTAGLEPDRP